MHTSFIVIPVRKIGKDCLFSIVTMSPFISVPQSLHRRSLYSHLSLNCCSNTRHIVTEITKKENLIGRNATASDNYTDQDSETDTK